jgi:hypothetical protein
MAIEDAVRRLAERLREHGLLTSSDVERVTRHLRAPEAHEYGPISGEEPTRALRPRVPRANVVLPFRRPKGTP